MPEYEQELKSFSFGNLNIKLWVPSLAALRNSFPKSDSDDFPYWAKLWPSAVVMANFITENPAVIKGKKIVEIAAGLGLPGIVAAHFASNVVISDYLPEAVAMIQSSVAANELKNVDCPLLNWTSLPDSLTADVLLLSDINYDPAAFEVLYEVLIRFLENGTTIVLATPQRLMAKPFIERFMPFCIQQSEAQTDDELTFISIFVFQK